MRVPVRVPRRTRTSIPGTHTPFQYFMKVPTRVQQLILPSFDVDHEIDGNSFASVPRLSTHHEVDAFIDINDFGTPLLTVRT